MMGIDNESRAHVEDVRGGTISAQSNISMNSPHTGCVLSSRDLEELFDVVDLLGLGVSLSL